MLYFTDTFFYQDLQHGDPAAPGKQTPQNLTGLLW